MPYEPFYERFLEIAQKETRTIIAINDPDLPEGEYGLTEAYCNESDCDCRRVFFNVVNWQTGKVLAVIAYGWESKRFYAKWFGQNDPKIIKEMQGPALNFGSPQSELAPALLERVKYVLKDKKYVDRLKRHYRMFKETVDAETYQKPKPRRVKKTSSPSGSRKRKKKTRRERRRRKKKKTTRK